MGKFLCKFQGHHKYTRISVTLFRLSEAEDIFYSMNKNHYMWFQHLSGISEVCGGVCMVWVCVWVCMCVCVCVQVYMCVGVYVCGSISKKTPSLRP